MNSTDKESNQNKLDRLVELVGQSSYLESDETKEAVSLCREIGNPACDALVSLMVKDIVTRLDSDNSHRSYNAALVLGKVGKMSIPTLSLAVRISSYAHTALGFVARFERDRAAKKQAINILNTELISPDWMRVAAAARGLGNSKNKRFVPVLKKLQKSTSNYEIMKACDNALDNLAPISQILSYLMKK